jgi:hypothetical protein
MDGPLDGQRLPTSISAKTFHLREGTHRHCYVRGCLRKEEAPRPGVLERIDVEVWIYQGCHD